MAIGLRFQVRGKSREVRLDAVAFHIFDGAAAACYVALWRLPRPDFHRLVIRTFHGAPCTC